MQLEFDRGAVDAEHLPDQLGELAERAPELTRPRVDEGRLLVGRGAVVDLLYAPLVLLPWLMTLGWGVSRLESARARWAVALLVVTVRLGNVQTYRILASPGP